MRPAFASTPSAAAFALLLLALLVLPAVVGKNLLPPREQAYARLGWGSGPYPWIENQIYHETNDIDIVFIGSSHIFNAINTPYVQAQLSARLGRPAVVRTLAWGGAGYDALYFIARDLLAQRRVRLMVFYDEHPAPGIRHNQTPAWFRFGSDAGLLAGLAGREQGLFYFAAIIGMPRNLLSLVRPNLPAPLVTDRPNYWETVVSGGNPATQLGCLRVRRGFALDPAATFVPFAPYMPATAARPADALVYVPATREDFEFSHAPLPAWSAHFARQFAALARQQGVKTVMLYLPVRAEVRSTVIPERTCWPDLLGDVTLLGIPPAKLFGSLTGDELDKIYADPAHFNQNGQEYFTRLITPALIQLYEAAGKH